MQSHPHVCLRLAGEHSPVASLLPTRHPAARPPSTGTPRWHGAGCPAAGPCCRGRFATCLVRAYTEVPDVSEGARQRCADPRRAGARLAGRGARLPGLGSRQVPSPWRAEQPVVSVAAASFSRAGTACSCAWLCAASLPPPGPCCCSSSRLRELCGYNHAVLVSLCLRHKLINPLASAAQIYCLVFFSLHHYGCPGSGVPMCWPRWSLINLLSLHSASEYLHLLCWSIPKQIILQE